MTLSIIIPTYNRIELTTNCLASLNRCGPDAEIIVVDNASTDGTAKIATIRNQTNVGFAEACNQGAAHASGDTLIFLNNDTVVHQGWGKFTDLLDDPTIAIAGPQLRYPDGTIQCAGVGVDMARPAGSEAWNLQTDWADKPTDVDAITGACLAIKAETFQQLGQFDTGFINGYEDVDLCMKATAAGWRCVYDPTCVVTHLESQSGPERWQHVAANVNRLRTRWSRNP